MDKIWAPWRSQYVGVKKPTHCIFCIDKKRTRDKQNYVLRRARYTFSILNRYPYNNGHVMVAPYRHVGKLESLTQKELLDLFELVNYTKIKTDKSLKPMGYNIGINVGKVAGAGFPGHIHVHIVPRWQGDTNFMPILGDTKMISYSLDAMYKLLHG